MRDLKHWELGKKGSASSKFQNLDVLDTKDQMTRGILGLRWWTVKRWELLKRCVSLTGVARTYNSIEANLFKNKPWNIYSKQRVSNCTPFYHPIQDIFCQYSDRDLDKDLCLWFSTVVRYLVISMNGTVTRVTVN